MVTKEIGDTVSPCCTFEVEVFGAVDILRDRLGVYFESVRVGGIARDDHVVPLVVVQWVVAVSLQQAGPVPQVEHIVDEPGRREEAADGLKMSGKAAKL